MLDSNSFSSCLLSNNPVAQTQRRTPFLFRCIRHPTHKPTARSFLNQGELALQMDSRLYDITTHITTSVIFSKATYEDFGHRVEESYRFRCRILCENDFAVEA